MFFNIIKGFSLIFYYYLLRILGIKLLGVFNYIPEAPNNVFNVVDIGANEGTVSIFAYKNYPNATIFCFEPVNSTFKILNKRTNKYKEDRFKLFNYGLGSENKIETINLMSHHGANSILAQSNLHKAINPHITDIRTEQITIKSLDSLGHILPPLIDIVKIDVEGYEDQVLLGGLSFFKNRVKYIVIEISFVRYEFIKLINLLSILEEFGFNILDIVEIYRNKDKKTFQKLIQFDCILINKKFI